MGDMTEHFSRSEFACRCGCGRADVDLRLVSRLEMVRRVLDRPMVITSGARCPEWNRAVGGKPNSAHLQGTAADIQCERSLERFELVREALAAGFRRVGIARDFVHLDLADDLPQPRLWLY